MSRMQEGKVRPQSDPLKPTPQEAMFVREYMVDLNASRAHKAAGYAGGKNAAYNLLKTRRVHHALKAEIGKRHARLELDADKVLKKLVDIGMCDIGRAYDVEGRLRPLHEMPEEVRQAISEISVEELSLSTPEGRLPIGQVKKVKFWNKVDALDKLGKHLKLFVERTSLENPDGSALLDGAKLKLIESLERLAEREKQAKEAQDGAKDS